MDEARRLINACQGDFRDLVRAALLTGCRYGELARLEARDFDEISGTIYVASLTKSGKGRHVDLTDEGTKFFSGLTAGRRGSELMLRHDGEPWRKSNQDRRMREACKRANIDPPISFHQLRHGYASSALMGGAPLMVVAETLGHADTRMVEKHYGHLSREYVRDQIRKSVPRFVEEDDTTNIASIRGGAQ